MAQERRQALPADLLVRCPEEAAHKTIRHLPVRIWLRHGKPLFFFEKEQQVFLSRSSAAK
jgi:hypothetical protein